MTRNINKCTMRIFYNLNFIKTCNASLQDQKVSSPKIATMVISKTMNKILYSRMHCGPIFFMINNKLIIICKCKGHARLGLQSILQKKKSSPNSNSFLTIQVQTHWNGPVTYAKLFLNVLSWQHSHGLGIKRRFTSFHGQIEFLSWLHWVIFKGCYSTSLNG